MYLVANMKQVVEIGHYFYYCEKYYKVTIQVFVSHDLCVNQCFSKLEVDNLPKARFILHSIKLFCRGVPVRQILRLVRILFMAMAVAVASFFRRWPSSHTTKSGPMK